MVDLNALTRANASRWQNAKLTRKTEAANIAVLLFKAKARYQAVEAKTGVPWFIIAVIHEREASQKWNTQLGQGDPLNAVSIHRPAGRGPFRTWEDGAYDALVLCPPFLARQKDWSLGAALTALEAYNGTGYAAGPVSKRNGVVVAKYPPQASPYLWAGTDQYASGKYIADGEFSPTKVDPQMGCAALLMALMALDPTITFTGVKIIPPLQQPVPVRVPAPEAKGGFWSTLKDLFIRKE